MRVLIAEDDSVNRHVLETFLKKWGYEVAVVRDGVEAWEILQTEDAPKLAILDWMMPGMDGVQLCQEVRKLQRSSYTYILLLTAKFQRQDIVAGLDAGADDYLTKPFDSNELRARIRAGRRILELQEQLLAARKVLEIQATHDSLTGLWNHGAILDLLQSELARARREQTTTGIILADLDHFKQVNDTYGHLAGDVVLREVAERMRDSVRSYDAVGRYGGEEFLVMIPQSDIPTVMGLAERLRLCIGHKPVDTPEGMIPTTVSLGVACSKGSGPEEKDSLLRAADLALYSAKQNGRNRIESEVNVLRPPVVVPP